MAGNTMMQATARFPFDGASLRNCLTLWLKFSPAVHAQEDQIECAVRDEAKLILDLLQSIEVVASMQELLNMCSDNLLEIHMTKALLAGGAAGGFDMPQMFCELRAACDAGSIWAPLWLGDLDAMQSNYLDADVDASSAHFSELERRQWYLEAAVRGHPDALERLKQSPVQPAVQVATMDADDFAKLGIHIEDETDEAEMVGICTEPDSGETKSAIQVEVTDPWNALRSGRNSETKSVTPKNLRQRSRL